MDLSIVIVNYNVKHFLEQCLHSVEKAIGNLNVEVFVVDNDSVDGSCQMVYQKFPWVKVIQNKENLGFAKANNQAIRKSEGKYVLLLNPDTFVKEDTLVSCFNFCENNPDAGGLGVKMIDGKGNFLPESKRSLPTPAIAFYKIFGLSAIFPGSRVFGKYHLGYLDKDKIHKVEILAGAFMWLRKETLDKTGLLDEDFFMYGEDIDLSYRIIKAGYNNYYYPETTIIHYKGESTKKGSINYVMVFYKAMIIFANKHFTAKKASLYSLLINIAIYFRASIGIVRRMVSSIFAPVLDFLLVFAGFYFFTPIWENFRFSVEGYYPVEFHFVIVPVYILVWQFFVFLLGGYENRIRPFALVRAVISGTLVLLIVYALLPESLRFSRVLLLLGSAWALVVMFFVRLTANALFRDKLKLLFGPGRKRIAIVGSEQETNRVKTILTGSEVNFEFAGRVSHNNDVQADDTLGRLYQVEEIIKINKIDELVFCSTDIPAGEIIETMLSVKNVSIDFKIAPPESVSVIGSNSINTAGDLYVVDINSLNKGVNKRKKRMFDILSGVILLLLYPLLVIFMNNRVGLLKNCLMVVAGRKTWVGLAFDRHYNIGGHGFKTGILAPSARFGNKKLSPALEERMNIMYAKDYRVLNDFIIVLRNLSMLGKQK
ncbi:MAG: glycosyltransferase [Bacteroidales bacterium]|nr:glycosyltransferase [Bacteroidales bacterium]